MEHKSNEFEIRINQETFDKEKERLAYSRKKHAGKETKLTEFK